MKILSEKSRQKVGRKRRYCTIQCDCGNIFEARKDTVRENITCKDCLHLRYSNDYLQHGIFSKHNQNADLRKCFLKCNLMTFRSYSKAHPTYKGICFGLDTKRNSPLDVSLNLMEILGVPPEGKSIEKEIGGYYWCGRCFECLINNQPQTLVGYVDINEQQLTKSSTILFQYKQKLMPLSSVGKNVGVHQSVINYLYYTKYRHLPKDKRWAKVNQELIDRKNCEECKELELV